MTGEEMIRPDKLHNGFGFVVQFRVGIWYLSCQGRGQVLIKRNSKEMWREVVHLVLFGGKKKVRQEFRRPHHNHLTSINSEIDRRDDGNVLVAQELSDALRAKIRWGILTP